MDEVTPIRRGVWRNDELVILGRSAGDVALMLLNPKDQQ
jgi:hypothetical protein